MNAVVLAVVHYTTTRHPFLDADNRHYSTKFYRHVITTHRKYWMVPIYSYIFLHFHEQLKERFREKYLIFLLGYMVCALGSLTPTPLFDFRYFIAAWALLAVRMYDSEIL